MRKVFTLVAVLLSLYLNSYSQEVDSLALMLAEIESSLNYEKGVIELEAGNAILHVPEGFGLSSFSPSLSWWNQKVSSKRTSTTRRLYLFAF